MRLDWAELKNLKPDSPRLQNSDLVDISHYKKQWRTDNCAGVDPLEVVVAYAQNILGYDEKNRLVENKFISPLNVLAFSYKPDAKLYLHETLAEICVRAAVEIYNAHGWKMVVFDGLRTMEGHYKLYELTPRLIIDSGVLTKPGKSAHNRAMAVDWMAFALESMEEIPMGAHFDCSDMELVHRENKNLPVEVIKNRRLREIAMQKSALSIGTIIAPLREEFWDDRMLGNETDFWRAIESIARCLNVNPPNERATDYDMFKTQFDGFDLDERIKILGQSASNAPKLENIVFHEIFRPIYSAELPDEMQQV